MDQPNYFQLAVRIIGLVVCLYGLNLLREFVTIQLGWWSPERTEPVLYFSTAASYLVVGLYLLRGAPHFMRYAFPENDVKDDEEDNTDDL